MSFVRTTSVIVPRTVADNFFPGQKAYNALVGGRKFVAQSMNGLVQTNVWRSTGGGGKVVLTIFTEWSTMEDLLAYANHPTIKELETLLSSDESPLNINTYEVIG